MKEYPKISSLYKRDQETFKFIEGKFTLPEFEFLKDNEWIFTEKVDGTNIRIVYDGMELIFKGKTDKAQIPSFLLDKLHEIFDNKIEYFKQEFPEGICLYGEGYGAKIQHGGGNYIPNGVDFVLFDIKIGKWWLKREDVEAIGSALGLRVVPIIGIGTLQDMINMVKTGIKSQWGDFKAEGIVARPKVELKARNGERIIIKAKTKDFEYYGK